MMTMGFNLGMLQNISESYESSVRTKLLTYNITIPPTEGDDNDDGYDDDDDDDYDYYMLVMTKKVGVSVLQAGWRPKGEDRVPACLRNPLGNEQMMMMMA